MSYSRFFTLNILAIITFIFPAKTFAEINTLYDLKLKLNEVGEQFTKNVDNVENGAKNIDTSAAYGTLVYSAEVIGAFLLVILLIFFLITLLKK